jgi:hypothetical protein
MCISLPLFIPSLEVNVTQGDSMVLEKVSMMAVIAEKLNALGGEGKLLEREWRIRSRLNWHTKASSAVRHLIYGERKPTVQEVKEIEAAHVKYCAERIEANRDENAKLFAAMRHAIEAMEKTDPDFYRPHIEAVGDILLRGRNVAGEKIVEV